MSNSSKLEAALDAAINTEDNPTRKILTKRVKDILKQLSRKLPKCFIAHLELTHYEDIPEKTMVIVDWRIGNRLSNQSFFEFIEGKEIPKFPAKVYVGNIEKLDQHKHEKTLREFYRESSKQGIITYINLIYAAVKFENVHNIENANLVNQ